LNLSEPTFLNTISHSSAYSFTNTLSPYFGATQIAVFQAVWLWACCWF